MKKIVFLLAVLLSTTAVFAQTEDGEDEIVVVNSKKNTFFLGPKIGGVLTSMSQPTECDLYDAQGFGLSAGLSMKARFNKATENSASGTGFWGLGLELKYKNNSVKTIGMDEEYNENAKLSLNYFEVPVYLHVYPFARTSSMNSFYIELGASFATALSRSPKSLTVTDPNPEMSSITYNFDTEGSTLKGNDVRPLAGIGYTIPNTGLDINVRYYIGTSELAKNFPCKMNSLEFSLSWMFKGFKF